MPASRSAPVEKSYTKQVTDALEAADDLLSIPQLAEVTGLRTRSIATSLNWLKKVKVVEAVEEAGRLYWFLSGNDARSKTMDEHRREDEPRVTRRGRRITTNARKEA